MTAKQKRRRELFFWIRNQYATLTARQMASTMTCESLTDDETPWHHRKAVGEFRKLRSDARVSVCRTYLRDVWPTLVKSA